MRELTRFRFSLIDQIADLVQARLAPSAARRLAGGPPKEQA
jgi:hypothetical protein